jgi:hypothetical protein
MSRAARYKRRMSDTRRAHACADASISTSLASCAFAAPIFLSMTSNLIARSRRVACAAVIRVLGFDAIVIVDMRSARRQFVTRNWRRRISRGDKHGI